MGLGDRDTTRAKGTLKDGEGKREGIRAFESIGEEAGKSNLGSTARSHRNK